MEYNNDKITIDPNICNGKPTVRDTRITVQSILEYLSAGNSNQEILYQFPALESDDISACIKFAAELLNRNFTIKTLA